MIYAVNLADLMWAEFPVKLLINPVLDSNPKNVLNAEPGKLDGMAATLNCDEERAKAIIEIVRLKVPKHQLRFYESATGNSWRRL